MPSPLIDDNSSTVPLTDADAAQNDPWLSRLNPGGNAPAFGTTSEWKNDLVSQASDAAYRKDEADRQTEADKPFATLGAAVTTTDNSVVALGRALFNPEPETTKPNNFNVPEAIQRDGLWNSSDYLMKSASEEDYNWRKSIVHDQMQAEDVLAHSGFGGTVAKLAVGALDPIYLVPGLGEMAAEGRIAKFALNAVGFTAINYGEQKVKDYQTGTNESNFTGAALSSLIPATLMGIGGMILKPSANKAMQDILSSDLGGVSMGAAYNPDLSAGGLYDAEGNLKSTPIGEGSKQVTNIGIKAINAITPDWLTPRIQKALNSESETVRRLAGVISGNSNMTNDVAAGKATADVGLNFAINKRVLPVQADLVRAENAAQHNIAKVSDFTLQGRDDEVINDLNNINIRGDFEQGGTDSLVDAIKTNWQNLAIQAAQRSEPSVIPAIEAIASKGRAIYQNSWKEAVEKGLAEGDPDVVPKGWGVTIDKDKVLGTSFQPEISYALRNAAAEKGEVITEEEANQMASQYYNTIRDTGTVSQGQLITKLNELNGIGGKLSKLVIGLDPSVTAKYAVDGFEKTMMSHLMYTSRQYASIDMLGHDSWSKVLTESVAPLRKAEIDAMREANHSNEDITANEKAHAEGMQTVSRMYDEAMGLNDRGQSWAALRGMGAFANMASLGAAPLTLGTAGIMTGSRAVGMANLLGDLGKHLTDREFATWSREFNEQAGIATELAISGHLHADANSQAAMNSFTVDEAMQNAKQLSTAGVANGLQKMSEKFQWLSGSKWTVDQFRQSIANVANMQISKMALDADKNGFESLSLPNKQFLGTYSVTPELLQRIADEVKSNPEATRTFGDHTYADTRKWNDQAAAYALDTSLMKVSHTAFHSIQPGSLPPIFDNPGGRAMFKFMAFIPAMHQQFLIAGLQGDKAALATSMFAGAILGALNVRLREVLGGKDPDQDRQNLVTDMTGWKSTNSQFENIASLLASGILKTGSGGIPQAILEHAVPLGHDLLGAKPDTGQFLTDLAGPTGSEIGALGNSVIDLKKLWDGKEMTDSQIRRGFRGAPGANLYGIPVPYILAHDAWNENNYWKNLQAQVKNPLGGPQ